MVGAPDRHPDGIEIVAEREYIKLTPLRQRSGFGIISTSRSNLWLAKDHLLCVETEGYTESYKRFFFQDLQAITLRRTSRGRLLGAVTGGIAACFGVFALTASAIEGRWILGSLAAAAAVFALARAWQRRRGDEDLGSVSHQWVAEHRLGHTNDSRDRKSVV